MTDQSTVSTSGGYVRRWSYEHNTVKVGDRVRCMDNMRLHGQIGEVVAFVHTGRRHPVTVLLLRKDGTAGSRRATFYEWEKVDNN